MKESVINGSKVTYPLLVNTRAVKANEALMYFNPCAKPTVFQGNPKGNHANYSLKGGRHGAGRAPNKGKGGAGRTPNKGKGKGRG